MPKPTLQNLSKLLNAFRKDSQVNIFRKDGITHIRVMSDDYVSMFECASNTGGDDYDEIAIKSIAITRDEITGDKQEKKTLIAHLPDFVGHTINFNVDGNNFASCIKKHSEVITGLHNDGSPYSKAVLEIGDNLLHLSTHNDDVGIKEAHNTTLNITQTGNLAGFMVDAIRLYRSIFKYITIEEPNIRIMRDVAPFEMLFNIDCYQCHYIQAPMIDN